jgi:hypothetical protein
MKRSESEFCRDQAARLVSLAKDCTDKKVRDHLIEMAQGWLLRADETENENNKGNAAKGTSVKASQSRH